MYKTKKQFFNIIYMKGNWQMEENMLILYSSFAVAEIFGSMLGVIGSFLVLEQ